MLSFFDLRRQQILDVNLSLQTHAKILATREKQQLLIVRLDIAPIRFRYFAKNIGSLLLDLIIVIEEGFVNANLFEKAEIGS